MAKNNGDTYFRVQIIDKPGNYIFDKYLLEIHSNLPKSLFPLTVRTRKSGDTFKLNGRDGYKKVNRLFIDQKVPQWFRDQMPVILDKQQRIIAVGDLYQQQQLKQWIIISKMEMNSVMHNDLKEVLLTEEDIQNICKNWERN